MTRVALVCCHLSGTGHLVRTCAVARALAAAKARPVVISGGRPLPQLDGGGIEIVQLPPVQVPDFNFSSLRTLDGQPADRDYMASRRAGLERALADLVPNALVTETFPFGRRALAAEFGAAITAARLANASVRVIASVRDIPEPPKTAGRIEDAAERLRRDYDAVLVHGDPEFLPLSATWPMPEDLAPMIRHTGYVAAGPAPGQRPEDGSVLVAVGGGVLGRRMLEIAAAASGGSSRPWRLLTGGPDAAELAAGIAAAHPNPNLTVEPARKDYRTLLAAAACSVSLAGYNTVLDLAACTTPAIVVPFDEHDEREQVIRAGRLAGFAGFTVMRVGDLTPERLSAAVEAAAAGPRREPLSMARDGAARAAAAILELAR